MKVNLQGGKVNLQGGKVNLQDWKVFLVADGAPAPKPAKGEVSVPLFTLILAVWSALFE